MVLKPKILVLHFFCFRTHLQNSLNLQKLSFRYLCSFLTDDNLYLNLNTLNRLTASKSFTIEILEKLDPNLSCQQKTTNRFGLLKEFGWNYAK